MLYQLLVNVYTQDKAHLEGAINSLISQTSFFETINPGTPEHESSNIQLIENHHDEHPSKPCLLVLKYPP